MLESVSQTQNCTYRSPWTMASFGSGNSTHYTVCFPEELFVLIHLLGLAFTVWALAPERGFGPARRVRSLPFGHEITKCWSQVQGNHREGVTGG